MIAANDFATINSPCFLALDAIYKTNQKILYWILLECNIWPAFATLEKKFLTVTHHRIFLLLLLLLLLLLVFEFNSHRLPPIII